MEEEIQYKDEWELSDGSIDENDNNENNEENEEENLEEMNEENEEIKIETVNDENEQTKNEEINKVKINEEEIPLYEDIQTPKEEELNKGLYCSSVTASPLRKLNFSNPNNKSN